MFSLIYQGPTPSAGSLYFSNAEFNSSFCTTHNIGSFIFLGPNIDSAPSENRLIIPLTNEQISLASSYIDPFFKFLQTQLPSSNILLLSSSSASLPSLLLLLLFVMKTTGEGFEPSLLLLKNALPSLVRLLEGLRGLEMIRKFEKVLIIQNLQNFQKNGISMMGGRKEEGGGGRRDEGGAKKEDKKLGGKARRENKENKGRDEGKKGQQKIELGGQLNNFKLPAISNTQKNMQNQIPPTPPVSFAGSSYPPTQSLFLPSSLNYPTPPSNYPAQSYPSVPSKNVNALQSYSPQQYLPPNNSFNDIPNNSSYPSCPPPSSIPPSTPSSLPSLSTSSPPPSFHPPPSSSYQPSSYLPLAPSSDVPPPSSFNSSQSSLPPPASSFASNPAPPPSSSFLPPSSQPSPSNFYFPSPPGSSLLPPTPPPTLTNPNFTNMDFKTHAIESYAPESEPQLYFDDINCIIEPENQKTHLPLQDLTRKFMNGNSREKGGLFLGNLRAAKNVELLKSLDIGAVLTVAQEAQPSFKSTAYPINHAVIEAHDVDDYNLEANFRSCFQFIDEQR